jgi:hypothetical protein
MPPWIRPEHVREHLPAGRKLPARFDAFVRAEPPHCRIEWNDLDAYSLKPSATEEAVPFLRLPDGGLAALWYRESEPAVVHIGGHGELKVLARTFDDFLKALAVRRSGLPDLDTDERPAIVVPGIGRGARGEPTGSPPGTAEPDTRGLAELQERFERWFKEHTALLPPLRTPEAEELRCRVFAAAQAMTRDNRPKPFSTGGVSYWRIMYRIERTGSEPTVEYLDYGKWLPVPAEYGLTTAAAELLELVKDKDRDRYEFVVNFQGLVSVDRDRQLLLLPPVA